jgi:hypothetical protein
MAPGYCPSSLDLACTNEDCSHYCSDHKTLTDQSVVWCEHVGTFAQRVIIVNLCFSRRSP